MNCEMTIPVGEPDAQGWRTWKCTRPGCERQTKPTPHTADQIHFTCHGWPRWWELGYWAEFSLAVVGISEPQQHYARLKLGFVRPVLTIGDGPGTELINTLASLGITDRVNCECRKRAKQMNDWGPDGCLERREEIVGWLREGAAEYTRWEWQLAALLSVKAGLTFRLKWSDPLPSLVDLAIRRARG